MLRFVEANVALADARRTRLLGEAVADWPDEDLARLTDYLERLNASVARHPPVGYALDARKFRSSR
ncbi:hypothetical protein [Streptomyces sp. Inha503]|uniref:hypothetical protein n=1 Tax=Streptomyces sp. Inha503 TaxID=3383314 RepID=UPI00399F9758